MLSWNFQRWPSRNHSLQPTSKMRVKYFSFFFFFFFFKEKERSEFEFFFFSHRGGWECLIDIYISLSEFGVSSFKFVEDIAGQIFEAGAREGCQFLSCLVSFGMKVVS
jgi:hypothetical protein